ncbi:MAG: hypothetical protein E6I84_06655 [Chloroflexi bacterium]|nr:MAG: hypothetical protein E6I84_06655 [Chloroflexota bacterium]
MNAAIFTKPAKGLILASGFLAASSIMGFAQDAPVALGAQATVPLSTLYVSAPTGSASLGGHTFDLSGGNLLTLGNGQSATFSGSWAGATSAFLLLNTYNTYWWYQGAVVGNVTFTFSDGTTQSTDLTVGGNIREWRTGAGFTVNTLSDPAAANVWTGSAQPGMGGGTAVIDMLTIALPSKTVTSVTLNDNNTWGALQIDLAGLTIDPVAPQASCNRPGNSCITPAAQNSQAWKWQPLQPGTTVNTNPHANNADKTNHKSH